MAQLNELAVSMHRLPGVYALLLGSGLSRAAKVLTGWEVTLDLVRRLAIANGSEPADLEVWYRDTFGAVPDYSELLERIAPTEAERRGILEAYFEPNQRESEQGDKLPTAAHKAIAKLVAKGYVRVILTTNFDRLLEQALVEEGIQPFVVSSPDAIQGAPPYTHNRVTLIKLHGDYKDSRIKNSTSELAEYDAAQNAYLDRVLDEFGLIVAGWSGDWDAALREAILRMANRRYSLYWLAYSDPSPSAQGLIDFRRGQVVSELTADQFFGSLLAKVEALEAGLWSSPKDIELLIAEVKRYLAEPERYGIRLEDLILDEARALAKVMQEDNESCPGFLYPENVDEYRRCVEHLEAKSERFTRLLSTVVRYDRTEAWSSVLTRAVGLLAREPQLATGSNDAGKNIRFYPLRIVLTALCTVTAQEGRIKTLQDVSKLPYERSGYTGPIFGALLSLNQAKDAVNRAYGQESFYPFAVRAAERLLSWLKPVLLTENPYYSQGEFLLSLATMKAEYAQSGRYWPPLGGRFMYQDTGAIEALVKSKPEWFQTLFPDFADLAKSFDTSADKVGSDEIAIRLGRLSSQ